MYLLIFTMAIDLPSKVSGEEEEEVAHHREEHECNQLSVVRNPFPQEHDYSLKRKEGVRGVNEG